MCVISRSHIKTVHIKLIIVLLKQRNVRAENLLVCLLMVFDMKDMKRIKVLMEIFKIRILIEVETGENVASEKKSYIRIN